jgi:hypothetical protein
MEMILVPTGHLLGSRFKMDDINHNDHEHASDPHAVNEMSDMHGSHDRHAGHSVAMFRDKFWLSLALTIPVVFWSTDVQHWLGYTAPSFPGSRFIPAKAQRVSVDEVFASAFAEQVSAWERLQQRAARGTREEFLAALDKVPDIEPDDSDRH